MHHRGAFDICPRTSSFDTYRLKPGLRKESVGISSPPAQGLSMDSFASFFQLSRDEFNDRPIVVINLETRAYFYLVETGLTQPHAKFPPGQHIAAVAFL